MWGCISCTGRFERRRHGCVPGSNHAGIRAPPSRGGKLAEITFFVRVSLLACRVRWAQLSKAPPHQPIHRRRGGGSGLIDDYRVAHRDLPVAKDVHIDAAAVQEIPDDPRPGQPLQVQAWLADFDAETVDISNAETLAD